MTIRISSLLFLSLAFCSSHVSAGSATWDQNPTSGDWNTAANWTPATIPNGPNDSATFNTSSITALSLSADVGVRDITYSAGGAEFTITVFGPSLLGLSAGGITNNSGLLQRFITGGDTPDTAGGISFERITTAGDNVSFTNMANGSVEFVDKSKAGSAIFENEGGASADQAGGSTDFFTMASADNATITNDGGLAAGAPGGITHFYNSSQGANAVLIANGGVVPGAGGGTIVFNSSIGGTAQIKLYGNGTLDLTSHSHAISIGSLEGDGLVLLGSLPLSVGTLNSDTIYSGVISGTGAITKVGLGTWTINGDNTYTGVTRVSAGTLAGGGTLAGSLSVSMGAFLAPSDGLGVATTLTAGGRLTFQESSSYSCALYTRTGQADQVQAAGVTIDSGAQFNLIDQVRGHLRKGTVFTVISNTASIPISGTFANLPDGGTITVNGTTFQASYEGGDGNDLALTVQ